MLFDSLLGLLTYAITLIPSCPSATEILSQVPLAYNKQVIDSELSSHVERLMNIWNVTGLTLAVVRPDGETEFGAWGNKTEDGERLTPDTLFNIASCSKAFLSASMGILIDDYANGRNETALPPGLSELDWNSKIKDILPEEWKLQDQWATEKANILDILSHVSGLPRHDASYGLGDTPRDTVHRLRHLRPAYELRERWSYNNMMYMAGAHILSTYAGSYTKFVKDRIFTPLGMNSSTFSPTEAIETGKLSQSWSGHSQRLPFWYSEDAVEFMAGPGGVISSVVDLSKWLKMLLNSGVDPATNKTVVPKSAFDAATTAHAVVLGHGSPDTSLQGYGMGWLRYSYQGHEIVWHNGAIPGFSTIVAFLPAEGLGMTSLINTADKATVNEALMLRIVEHALNLRKIPRADDPAAYKRAHTPRAENATVPLPLAAYAGTYTNAGYGGFTLCAPASDSQYCTAVRAAFAAVDAAASLPAAPPPGTPQLLGAWPRAWGTHVRAVHFAGSAFNVSLTALFPAGFGADTTPFETSEMDEYVAVAEFVVEGGEVVGFGLFDAELLDGVERRKGQSVRERADVWFRKI